MISQDEISALAQILNRAPMSRAEALWAQNLLTKLQVMARDPRGTVVKSPNVEKEEKDEF